MSEEQYLYNRFRRYQIMAEGIIVRAESRKDADALAADLLRRRYPASDWIEFECVLPRGWPYHKDGGFGSGMTEG